MSNFRFRKALSVQLNALIEKWVSFKNDFDINQIIIFIHNSVSVDYIKKKSVLIATTDILHDKKLTFFILIPNFDKKCLF